MAFVVQAHRPDPFVRIRVTDEQGRPTEMTVLSGVVAVGPESTPRMRMHVRGQIPPGEPVGLYLTDGGPLPVDGAISIVAEASLTQVVIDHMINIMELPYGIGDVAAQLALGQDNAARWPLLTFQCHGSQPIGVRYRVTLLRPL